MSIERNVEVGKIAIAGKELLEEFFSENGLNAEEVKRAYNKIANSLRTTTNEKPLSSMSYQEARKWFRNCKLPFGIHKGKKISEVPIEYLLWLDNQEDFRRDLRRFLSSEFFSNQHYI